VMMDAENLRETYNRYFSQEKNRWTSSDTKKTEKVARQTVQWLKQSGYTRTSGKFLDVGCATGFYTEAFRTLGFDATGLDYSEEAVKQATKNFPQCTFIQMNGFEPVFQEKFDLIFCRGFSGANTHDLTFIATWMNKYVNYLSDGGFFVLGYSSDFSGKENEGETVNLSRKELKDLTSKINASYTGTHVFYYFGLLSKVKRLIDKTLLKKPVKDYYYLLFRKS
jgi:SAM-dependent methyltransferase